MIMSLEFDSSFKPAFTFHQNPKQIDPTNLTLAGYTISNSAACNARN